MMGLSKVNFETGVWVAALGMVLFGVGCSGENTGIIGRSNQYDYSPSVIQSGQVRQYWWCGQGVNPNNRSQESDTIQYESVNLMTNDAIGPVTVLAETPGAWDSVFTCNPKVVEGTFVNPLSDGKTYNYAMYYVATANSNGNDSIGVAFSDDGLIWKKYPQPVIASSSMWNYGVGQPAVYNSDGKAGIWMFYEDSTPTLHHVAATSTDGLHFTVQGTLTTAGIDPDSLLAGWGDMAYDSSTGYWYAAFSRPLRDPSTTGGVLERGQYGVELYRVRGDSILTGATPWQELHTFDTNMTGYESNFIAGFVRDQFGNLNVGAYPTIQMYVSISNPQPAWDATPAQAGMSGNDTRWDLGPVEWVPNQPLLALNRYLNGAHHEVTTGWVAGGFKLESTLGHLYESPQQGATVAFYGCKRGSTDYFVSLDHACEGQRMLGKDGYGYAEPVAGLNLIPVYRCSGGGDHFVSLDAKCEGQTADELLGYVMP
jgi:hypothetical protein